MEPAIPSSRRKSRTRLSPNIASASGFKTVIAGGHADKPIGSFVLPTLELAAEKSRQTIATLSTKPGDVGKDGGKGGLVVPVVADAKPAARGHLASLAGMVGKPGQRLGDGVGISGIACAAISGD